MNFTRVDIFTDLDEIEPLTARLTMLGTDGFEISGDNGFEENISGWEIVDDELLDRLCAAPPCVTLYLTADEQGNLMLEEIKALCSNADKRYDLKTSAVAEEDWENNWKQYYKPFEAGGLLIKPPWEALVNPRGLPVLEIDPGSAFGTGQHATTRMCLDLLGKTGLNDKKVLDIGCGSGILSAAVILLGADYVCAIDISQNAARITEETLKRNDVSDKAEVYCGDLINDEILRREIGFDFDIITANITADVIIAMTGLFGGFLVQGGVLICSGIIAPRFDEVAQALSGSGFAIAETRESEGWNALVCHRK